MKVLNKIPIRSKLFFLISIMSAAILIVGFIGYRSSNDMADSLKSMYNQNIISIKALTDIRQQTRANYANMLKLAVTTSREMKKEIIADIDKRNATLNNDLKEYEKTNLDSFEKKNLDLMKDKLDKWQTISKSLIDLADSGKADEAIGLSLALGDKIFDDAQNTIKALHDYNITEADNVYKREKNEADAAILTEMLIILAAFLICAVLAVLITRSITSPLKKVTELIKKTSELNLIDDPSYNSLLKNRDETGAMVRSVAEMRQALRNLVRNISAISGDLTQNAGELNVSADENTKTVNQVVTAINEIAEANGHQAETINKASGTLNHIVENITGLNEDTAENAKIADESKKAIIEGQKAVDITLERMKENVDIAVEVADSVNELSTSIGRVGEITEVINSISDQTNMLALNAAIEAARAGEAGKGFAVVAEEIRKLADGSSKAAQEIAVIVRDTIDKNSFASENMNKAKEIVANQNQAVINTKEAFLRMETLLDNIAARTMSAAKMLSEITDHSKALSVHTQDMAAVAEQSAASSEEISASSEEQLAAIETIAKAASDLSGMAIDLNKEIGAFKI